MSNDYYHKTRKWLQNAIVDYIPSKDYIRSEIDIEMNIESIQRAIDALDIIFNPNLAVRSVESKNIVLGTINCIIDNSLLSDDQKIHYKETFSNEFKQNTNSFLFDVPQISKETIEELKKQYEDNISKGHFPDEIKHQMLGFYHTISHALNLHKYLRFRDPKGSFKNVLRSDNVMGGIGQFDNSLAVEYGPELVRLISNVVNSFPELFKNRFSNAIICRFFTGQFCSILATGKSQQEALKILFSEIKKSNPSLCRFFKNLVKEINEIREECLDIHPSGNGMVDGNRLEFFQLEFVHAYCNMDEKFIFNFDDPGLRKTATNLLALIVRLRRDGYREGRILVDCPPRLINMWKNEIKDRFNSDIVSVVNVHKDVLKGTSMPICPKNKFQVELVGHTIHSYNKSPSKDYLGIIVDEVHNNKQREGGKKSKRSQHVTQYIQNIPYRILGSGTPLVNELAEFVFIINAFSGKQIIPEENMKCAIGKIERAYLIQLYASPFIIRRRKRHIFELPPKKINIEEIILGRKQLAIREKMKQTHRNLADVARFEAPYKIASINKFINSFLAQKGLVFSGWINQSDKLKDVTGNSDGVLYQAFKKCPIGRPKIYIDGKKVVYIDGKEDTYDFAKAEVARIQFKESDGPVVAYVSLQTSREGINEFGKGIFVSYLTLPFEHATLNQSTDRTCRGINEIQNVHIPCICYLDQNGKKFYYSNKKIIRSFDEQCVKRIMIKEQLSNVICDAIKRDFATGEIEPWDVALDDFDSVLYVDPHPPTTKVKNGTYVAQAMNELSAIDPVMMSKRIKEINSEIKGDIFKEAESLNSAKHSLALTCTQIGKLNEKLREKISFAHVGCGKAQINQAIRRKCKNIYRFDLHCEGDGIVNCDRSEINDPLVEGHCEDNSLDLIAGTNMLHWQLDNSNVNREMVVNLSDTLISFNRSLKVGGLCIITCPLQKYDYPFARNKAILDRYGFELVEDQEFKSVRCFLLRKKKDFRKEVPESILVRLAKLLPKKIKHGDF